MDIKRPDLKAKRRRRQYLYGSLGTLAVIAAAIGIFRMEPAAPSVDRASVWTDTVKRGEMLREVRGPGVLVPREIRWIAAETSGRVERLRVKPGARVEPDSVLMELSNPDILDLLRGAEAALAAARADYSARQMMLESQLLDQRANFAGIEADHESARLQAEAERELNAKGIISDITYRRSELLAERLKVRLDIERERIAKFESTIQAQLAAERARLAQLENEVALRQRQRDGLMVRAGIHGVLQQTPVQEGQQVAAGTNLARVARPDLLMAELRIAETQAKDIALDQPVRVDTRNGVVPGRVVRIDPAVQNGTVQVDVDFEGELPPGARPDLTVDGTIEIERLSDVLYVGRPAYGQPNSTISLFRIDPTTGRGIRVPVRLGRTSVNLVEIEQGLELGDTVILSDTTAWNEYDRIRLN
jgi:HlyD family secretion protein